MTYVEIVTMPCTFDAAGECIAVGTWDESQAGRPAPTGAVERMAQVGIDSDGGRHFIALAE